MAVDVLEILITEDMNLFIVSKAMLFCIHIYICVVYIYIYIYIYIYTYTNKIIFIDNPTSA